MKKISWGIVATGRITHQFAEDLQFVKNSQLLAVASREMGKASAFAKQHGIEHCHDSYEALFADEQIDAVYIATPHAMHIDNIEAAATYGKAVLCEKPLVTSVAECKRVMQLSNGNYIMEALWTWFLPAIVTARNWVRQGRIGQLRQIKADFGYPIAYNPGQREWDINLGGGCLLEMGIYPVALAWYFLGTPANSMQVSGNRAENGAESEVSAILSYDDCLVTLGTSFLSKLQNWAYIIGDEGYIAIPNFWRANTCQLYVLDEMVDSYSDGRTTFGFNFEVEAMANDLLAGKKESEIVPLDSSLALQEEMNRIQQLIP